MIVPALAGQAGWALLLLRIWILVLFGTSGWSHSSKPREDGLQR